MILILTDVILSRAYNEKLADVLRLSKDYPWFLDNYFLRTLGFSLIVICKGEQI